MEAEGVQAYVSLNVDGPRTNGRQCENTFLFANVLHCFCSGAEPSLILHPQSSPNAEQTPPKL